MKFKLTSSYKPTGDQPRAISELTKGLEAGLTDQVLLGVTGSGKTFTVANIIEKLQVPTLVISHNKTLAGQLYQELRDFFPENAVSYFVSYYDYYQPEAYIPQSDTYIEKEADINKEIDKLRLQTTTNLLTRNDVIIVASVSCIYNIGSPVEYGNFAVLLKVGEIYSREDLSRRLLELQYVRSDYGFHRGTWRVRGEVIDIFPAYEDSAIRLKFENETLIEITHLDPTDGKLINTKQKILNDSIYPAKHYMMDRVKQREMFGKIREDLKERVQYFKNQNMLLEANRIEKRVTYDLEMIEEIGYVNGIENYSRYFDGRKPGDAPNTLIEYFRHTANNNFLTVIDESHMTIPQIGGMYNGDYSRKKTLIDYGFRLPAAYDNRPLRFDEFTRRIPKVLYTSATPAQWELQRAQNSYSQLPPPIRNLLPINGIAQQLIRPTGIPDPEVEVKATAGQVNDLVQQIEKQVEKKHRTLVTTLTKRMAEDLSIYLKEKGIKVHYLHSEINTLDRTDILDQLRQGEYDVLVGINLLREGLDLPEVSLVAILDADKEGFLRSETSLIQTMGRAARHIDGRVIMYADRVTGSMDRAIKEVNRRRVFQLEYNQKHNITPESISKPIRDKLIERELQEDTPMLYGFEKEVVDHLSKINSDELTPNEKKKLTQKLKSAMNAAARDLNFELAAKFRDRVHEIEK